MRRIALTTAAIAALLLGAGLASGELVQHGDLRLIFNGRFAPQSLPRERPAPVTVELSGAVQSTNPGPPPQLRRIIFAVNRYGTVSTRGLPICQASELQQSSTREALSRCRDALVGHGHFDAHVNFPNVNFPVEGQVVAFNGRDQGRPVILLHVYGSNPVQLTVVLTFKISHPGHGSFGTILSARIPKLAGDLGYVTDLNLTFGRRYRFRGRPESFLSAQCAAPRGFRGALFSFARGTFIFANGQNLTTTLARDCRVR
jgi:hypothetical protein